MKISIIPLIAFCICVAALKTSASLPSGTSSDLRFRDLIPGTYLVELDDDEDMENFYRGLGDAGIGFKRRLSMESVVFKGVSFRVTKTALPGGIAMSRISSRLKVKNTWPLRAIRLSQGASYYETPKPSSSSSLNVRRTAAKRPYEPHVQTGIDKLHAAGYTSKGRRIGIIDSGIDYNHPSLGGCFGKGCKVSYGWDLVGDNFTVGDDLVPDNDPHESMTSHGTHCAGIAGALQDDLGFVGAAPDAELGMFKVYRKHAGGIPDDAVIAAIVMAFDEGSDVISISLGIEHSWSQHLLSLIASRIVEQGVPVVAAAGNTGHVGLWQASGPANGNGVISVGIVNSIGIPYLLQEGSWTRDGGEPMTFGWAQSGPAVESKVTLPLHAVDSMNPGSKACKSLADDVDLSGKFVLLQHSEDQRECDFGSRLRNVNDKGATYVILFTSHNETIPDYSESFSGIDAMIKVPPYYAASWLEALEDGANITVTLPGGSLSAAEFFLEIAENERGPGAVNGQSSWGPTWDLHLKPEVLAPGADILSTMPLSLGGYAVRSGTSMACPLVAGLIALLIEARGTHDPEELLKALLSQAEPINSYDHVANEWSDHIAPVAQQGAGLVQGWKSAQVATELSKGYLMLNDTDNFDGKPTFRIHNRGEHDVSYALGHIKSATTNTLEGGPQAQELRIISEAAVIDFTSTHVTVPPGKAVEVGVIVSAPSNLEAKSLPVYGGYIQLQGSNNETLRLPYLGVSGSMKKTNVLYNGPAGYTHLCAPGEVQTPAEGNTTFEVKERESVADGAQDDDPTICITCRIGTSILRADVVALQETNLTTTSFFDYDFIGSLIGFPKEWQGLTPAVRDKETLSYQSPLVKF